MLKSLHIRNYVLIDSLDIEFREGFSVMTGETGAGKSIIIGALNLLLGSRADSRQIMQGEEKCTVEGHFVITGYGLEEFFERNGLDCWPDDTILRREVSVSGKSRAFINDTPVNLSQLRGLGSRLIDIHSQHQSLAIGTESFQIDTVDTIGCNGSLRTAYGTCFENWSRLSAELESLKAMHDADTADRDYLSFQLEGLEGARLTDGELERLERESEILEHAEEIKQELFHASGILDADSEGAITSVRLAIQALNSVRRNYPEAGEYADRLDSCLIELKDIEESIRDSMERVHFDPQRQEQVNNRLDLIYSLLKKHRKDSVAQLIQLTGEIRSRLDRADSFDEELKALESRTARARAEMEKAAERLSGSRRKASEALIRDIEELLVPLGIPNIRFGVDITPSDGYDRTGHDNLRFMFSANKSQPLQELSAVASGGEIARVMLSVKSLIAGVRTLPTVIFDEIDTGVSGAVAEKMAVLMKQMSAGGRQVLAITHLPQIAAMGATHYKVYKTDDNEATHTRISILNGDDRIREIASMMSGARLTQAALDNAQALVEQWKTK
ncbi:MAG: DNA repair protein RecN [Bacteroidaceae bacterium]|nr:DNA repair protein RecN [Bacteroidaceae bacterium]